MSEIIDNKLKVSAKVTCYKLIDRRKLPWRSVVLIWLGKGSLAKSEKPSLEKLPGDGLVDGNLYL